MYSKKFIYLVFIIFFNAFFLENTFSQSDTLKTYRLNEIEIKTQAKLYPNLSTSPEQIISKNQFEKMSAFQLSDAVKFFSGVQVKDYGGIGGLKTVSIRNMGANYTTIAYDGVPMTNYMTGQIDLSRFTLENIEMLRLNIGESDDIFLPARLQSLGGSLNIITQPYSLNSLRRNSLQAALKTGSYGLINPSLIVRTALSSVFTLNVSGEYLSNDGKYPYKESIGNINPTVVKRKRLNSDLEKWNLESNLSGYFNNGGRLLVKIHYFDSNRGIPGPSYYYNDENTGERIKDKNIFSQINYTQSLNEKWKFQTHAKYDYSRTDYNHLKVQQSNQYDQDEFYLNASFLYQTSENLSFSFSNDGSHGSFNSKEKKDVHRTSWLSSIAGKYQTSRFTFTGSLLNNYTRNSGQSDSYKNSNHLSPYLGLSFRPFEEKTMRLRFFYKNSYRLPTFGDLYYTTVVRDLKAENAHQYNAGITVRRSSGILFPFFAFSIDTYYNKVKNKIVITPRESPFLLSAKNHGEVDIKGIDMNLEFHINVSSSITAEFSGSYTYQDIKERKDGKKLILAYTPKHTNSRYFTLRTPWIDFSYNVINSGKRYYLQVEEYEYRLKAYSDHNISLFKRVKYKDVRMQLSAECLNIFNQSYEIIRSYPMPGRSFRFGLKLHI